MNFNVVNMYLATLYKRLHKKYISNIEYSLCKDIMLMYPNNVYGMNESFDGVTDLYTGWVYNSVIRISFLTVIIWNNFTRL